MLVRAISIARGQFYYGWIIVAVGFVTMFLVQGVQTWGLSLFFKPMSEGLGLNRATFSGVQSLSTVVSGGLAPFLGPLIDRRGARGLMILGAAITGAGLIALSFVQGLWDFYLVRGLIISVGFACAAGLSVNVAISNWFIRKRGKAVAMGVMGNSFAGMLLPTVGTYLILTLGWRPSLVVFGIATWLVVIPLAALFVKRRPEDSGLLPDGDSPLVAADPGSSAGGRAATSARPVPLTEETWTRSEAMRTSALWLTIAAFGFGTMGGGALVLHMFPFLTDISSERDAATAVSLVALVSFSCKLAWGALIDKVGVRVSSVALLGFTAFVWATLVILAHWPSAWLVYLSSILGGLSLGGMTTTQEVFWANYFGRLSLGAVRSVAIPFSLTFNALSPVIAGWSYDTFHSYQQAFAWFAVASALGSFLVYLSRPPRKKVNEKTARSASQEAEREVQVSRP
ncbi:MAG: MFS transporter [Chloroflexi bacterium]|nr:MFS transporter [Chloroflexota bacterium]